MYASVGVPQAKDGEIACDVYASLAICMPQDGQMGPRVRMSDGGEPNKESILLHYHLAEPLGLSISF